MTNLDPVEKQIIKTIIKQTENKDLAVLAIVLRRLFPKLKMEAIDIARIISETHNTVSDEVYDNYVKGIIGR